MGMEVLVGTWQATALKPPKATRRRFGAMAGGVATLGASSGAPPLGMVNAQSVDLKPVAGADNLGVNEAFKAMAFGNASGAGWTRWTVQWFNVQREPDEFNDFYFTNEKGENILDIQVKSGMKVAAMVVGTPEWAAETPGLKFGTSVPRGLYEPVFIGDEPNPDNLWGAFMFQLAKEYVGKMEVFEIWNEVEIPANGPNAVYNTWAGTPADYYQLLSVASQSAKKANPNARIVLSPYSYFKDKDAGGGESLPWFDAFGAVVKAKGADVFDVVALNLYRNPHDLWDRFHGGVDIAAEPADRTGFKARLEAIGAGGKPIWLTEINAMPYDDPMPSWNTQPDGFRITMVEQANYVLQAHALAFAAGYEKVFFQALQDDPYPVPDELWGLVRFSSEMLDADVSRARPAFAAFQVVGKYIAGAQRSELHIKKRQDPKRSAQYASRFEWAQHLAVFHKGDTRASVVWNGTDKETSVAIKAAGASAVLVHSTGKVTGLEPNGEGRLVVDLPPATRHFDLFGGDPAGYFYIGGPTFVIVEKGVPGDASVEAPGFARQEGK
jgi:hypothetical protein